MIQAKTNFVFDCPHCKKEVKKEVDFTTFDYKINTSDPDVFFKKIDVLWEGFCPYCEEWLFNIRL